MKLNHKITQKPFLNPTNSGCFCGNACGWSCDGGCWTSCAGNNFGCGTCTISCAHTCGIGSSVYPY